MAIFTYIPHIYLRRAATTHHTTTPSSFIAIPTSAGAHECTRRSTVVCQQRQKAQNKKLDRAIVVPSDAMAALESLPLGIIPTVDMSAPPGELARRLVRACAEHGFFRAVNHGVPSRAAGRLDAAASEFFARPAQEKQATGPPDQLGYGSRNIGAHGDVGELEYLILHTDPDAVAGKAKTIDTDDPSGFRYA
jgi:hypothetical protein